MANKQQQNREKAEVQVWNWATNNEDARAGTLPLAQKDPNPTYSQDDAEKLQPTSLLQVEGNLESIWEKEKRKEDITPFTV
ncbi:hypothetical protein Anapl_02286 [Anas platyrhynchos]|uniref:Uncharacterized protein n=1 Tax=Anas platyrhynchos TaxID=8839 RepID=R0M3Y0_ANAPL|nr:hypothetical protein Anapl_02286 [Anas platyrhynchos]